MLQAVLNGSRPEDAHPALPIVPRHLARDARAVGEQGVSSVHIHPRDPDGMETLDPAYVGDAVAAIRAEVPGMEIGVPTGRWIQPDPERRVEAVLAWGHLGIGKPDVCSVNVHERGWERVCSAAESVGIGVELGVWTSGDAVTLRRSRVPRGTTRVLAESTVSDPSTAVAEGVRIMRALGSDLGVPVLLHGEEGGAWPVLEYAMGLNIDTRIGFEDVLVLPDGWLATGNDNLVSKALGDRVRQAGLGPGAADAVAPRRAAPPAAPQPPRIVVTIPARCDSRASSDGRNAGPPGRPTTRPCASLMGPNGAAASSVSRSLHGSGTQCTTGSSTITFDSGSHGRSPAIVSGAADALGQPVGPGPVAADDQRPARPEDPRHPLGQQREPALGVAGDLVDQLQLVVGRQQPGVRAHRLDLDARHRLRRRDQHVRRPPDGQLDRDVVHRVARGPLDHGNAEDVGPRVAQRRRDGAQAARLVRKDDAEQVRHADTPSRRPPNATPCRVPTGDCVRADGAGASAGPGRSSIARFGCTACEGGRAPRLDSYAGLTSAPGAAP